MFRAARARAAACARASRARIFSSAPSNEAALALIERWPDWPDRALALVGPEGSGKSHLAAIWAEIAGARRISARALGETDLPGALATGALVVEDLAVRRFDERALFHLLNLVREEERLRADHRAQRAGELADRAARSRLAAARASGRSR